MLRRPLCEAIQGWDSVIPKTWAAVGIKDWPVETLPVTMRDSLDSEPMVCVWPGGLYIEQGLRRARLGDEVSEW